MSINFETLRTALKSTNLPVFRDKAKKGTKYPYIVYSFVSKTKIYASDKVFKRLSYYQVALFTAGTEKDLHPLENALEENGIKYADFMSIQGDENDETITNFFTYVRVIENGQEQ